MPGTCVVCAQPATTRCSRCKAVHYCSQQCQSRHWQTHRQSCKPPPPSSVLTSSSQSTSLSENKDPPTEVVVDAKAELRVNGCSHYKRKCALVSPCCDRVFPCRFCHDQEMYENETNPEKSHKINRHEVTHVVCLKCTRKQRASTYCGGDAFLSLPSSSSSNPSSSETSLSSTSLSPPASVSSSSSPPVSPLPSESLPSDKGCGQKFAAYCCLTCNLFDDEGEKKKIFHCADCGICRVGGRESFFHCGKCNACFSKELYSNHLCVEQSLQRNCPVCQEDMFSSRIEARVLPCGHTMHSTCLESFQGAGSYKCPTCNKTTLPEGQARVFWAQLRRDVEMTQMPPEYASTMVNVLCNDCNQRSNVSFHVVGHECSHCHSFNTVRE